MAAPTTMETTTMMTMVDDTTTATATAETVAPFSPRLDRCADRSCLDTHPLENATLAPSRSRLYMAFRDFGFPALYGENKTPETADVLIAGFIFAAVIVAISFYAVLPGYTQKLNAFLRVTLSIFIGTSIMVCNFGQEWEVARVDARVPYKAGIGAEIEAHLGLHIGLRAINVTMTAGNKRNNYVNEFKNAAGNSQNEIINYNERFWFGFGQGRAFFGQYANEFNQEFRAAQFRGLPLPILWIAEYFTFDGEGIRWGRHYRSAGWYTHIMMWLAFPLWIMSNILLFMVLRFAAYFLMMTGGSLIVACILFAGIRNPVDLKIPFETEHGQVIFMEPHFGWCWELALVTGIMCILFGLVILFMDSRFPDKIASFFDIDVLQDFEEYYSDAKQTAPAQLPSKQDLPIDGGAGSGAAGGAEADGAGYKHLREAHSSESLEMVERPEGAGAAAGEGAAATGEGGGEDDLYQNAAAIRQHGGLAPEPVVSEFRKRGFSKRFDKVKLQGKPPTAVPRKSRDPAEEV